MNGQVVVVTAQAGMPRWDACVNLNGRTLMPTYLIYVPHDEKSTAGADLGAYANRWMEAVNRRSGRETVRYFHMDSGPEKTDILRELAPTDSIFIMGGHGRGSQDYLFWKEERLTVDEYAKRFKIHFPTSIKNNVEVYSCYTGFKGETAFAYLFARKLKELGYSCRVFGFYYAVSKTYKWMEGVTEDEKITASGKLRYPEPWRLEPHLWGEFSWPEGKILEMKKFDDGMAGKPLMRCTLAMEAPCRIEFTVASSDTASSDTSSSGKSAMSV